MANTGPPLVEIELLSVLRDAGGSATPQWEATTERGYRHHAGNRTIDEPALEALVRDGYAEAIFFDRISRCPACRSHVLNMREVCTGCKSPHVLATELLHHFRCGYVAPAGDFAVERDGRRCPKCLGTLQHRGTDYDSPGPSFACGSCGLPFQLPEIGAVCLSCGNKICGADLEKIIYEDISSYKITPLGMSALRSSAADAVLRNAFADSQKLTEDGLPVLRRRIFETLLDDEQKRARRFKTPFGLLLLTARPPSESSAASDERALVTSISRSLTDTDKIGRYDATRYLVLLPQCDRPSVAQAAHKLTSAEDRVLRQWDVDVRTIDVSPDALNLDLDSLVAAKPSEA